ncbi:MAG: DNA mismatch repair protein MutT [Desulfuromonadaceae bacterium GWC2_58_13]|nr:MAG: DNA mismatch repair protein MutT [Desulfuromonadaceae bacterium GWC2_58_13]
MEFSKQPQIKTSVVACVIDEQDRVLLTRRCIEPFCSLWVMPGGKIDHGESILEALHREVKEEVGIEVRAEGLIDVFEHVNVGQSNAHFIILYYRASPLSFDLKPNGEECTVAVWVGKSALSGYPMPPGTRHILGKVFPELGWGDQPPPARIPADEIPGEKQLPQVCPFENG